jgi:hypothetical protein
VAWEKPVWCLVAIGLLVFNRRFWTKPPEQVDDRDRAPRGPLNLCHPVLRPGDRRRAEPAQAACPLPKFNGQHHQEPVDGSGDVSWCESEPQGRVRTAPCRFVESRRRKPKLLVVDAVALIKMP